jgi:hypothetical protein
VDTTTTEEVEAVEMVAEVVVEDTIVEAGTTTTRAMRQVPTLSNLNTQETQVPFSPSMRNPLTPGQ